LIGSRALVVVLSFVIALLVGCDSGGSSSACDRNSLTFLSLKASDTFSSDSEICAYINSN
jgi:hypothetical protein